MNNVASTIQLPRSNTQHKIISPSYQTSSKASKLYKHTSGDNDNRRSLGCQARHLPHSYPASTLLSMEAWKDGISGLALCPIVLRPPHRHWRHWSARKPEGRGCSDSQQHRPLPSASRNCGHPTRSVSVIYILKPLQNPSNSDIFSRRAVNPRLNRRLDILLEIKFHGIVNLGMVLIIIALVHLMNGEPVSKCKTLLNVGSAISCVAWVLLTAWALWSNSMVSEYSSYANMQTVDNGKIVSRHGHYYICNNLESSHELTTHAIS